MEFMELTELPFGLPGQIWRSPMPYSMFDPQMRIMDAYHQHNITMVVMLIEKGEDLLRSGRDLQQVYEAAGYEVLHLDIMDFGVAENQKLFHQAVQKVIATAKAGRNVVVHCLAGLGRTGMFLACVAKAVLALSGHDALDWIREHVPESVQTKEQEWIVLHYDPTHNKKG